jgi:hypothetical protein
MGVLRDVSYTLKSPPGRRRQPFDYNAHERRQIPDTYQPCHCPLFLVRRELYVDSPISEATQFCHIWRTRLNEDRRSLGSTISRRIVWQQSVGSDGLG